MLHDRTKWPQIQFPGRAPQRAQAYFSPMQTRTPQQMAYPAQHMTPGPAPKRARTQASQPHAPAQPALPAELMDDEEDTSRGDMFDHMTPREVSQSRYIQNHEWMEEVLSSPIPVDQLVPVDLGLGLGGELKKVTNGIFETYNSTKYIEEGKGEHEYVGRLDPGKADEFRKRVSEKIEADNKEIEKLKKRHAKRMAKLAKNGAVIDAEKALRTAVNDPSDIGTEYWRLEGKLPSNSDSDSDSEQQPYPLSSAAKVDDIVAQLEASLGLHTAAVKELRRIQDGGLQESLPPPPEPVPYVPSEPASPQAPSPRSAHSSLLVGDHELDMGSAAGLLDQFHTGFSAATTPGNTYTPHHIQGLSTVNSAAPSPAQQQPDVEMGGTGAGAAAETAKSDTGEWVVVPQGGVSPTGATPTATQAQSQAPSQSIPAPAQPQGLAATSAPTAGAAPATTAAAGTPSALAGAQAGTPAAGTGTAVSTPRASEAAEPVDFSGLDDLDTAGEALAGFEEMEGGMDLVDDSAFGEAFHGVEGRHDEGEGEGEGM